MSQFGLQLQQTPAWNRNRQKCGGFKWRSGSDLDCIPLQLFMTDFRLVLSAHASLSPVCKAPVSTSALYQPLFVRQAESHTSNNLSFRQFFTARPRLFFWNRRGAPCSALPSFVLWYFRDKLLLVSKARCRPLTLFSAKLKAKGHRWARGALRKWFWWAKKERCMSGSKQEPGVLLVQGDLKNFNCPVE